MLTEFVILFSRRPRSAPPQAVCKQAPEPAVEDPNKKPPSQGQPQQPEHHMPRHQQHPPPRQQQADSRLRKQSFRTWAAAEVTDGSSGRLSGHGLSIDGRTSGTTGFGIAAVAEFGGLPSGVGQEGRRRSLPQLMGSGHGLSIDGRTSGTAGVGTAAVADELGQGPSDARPGGRRRSQPQLMGSGSRAGAGTPKRIESDRASDLATWEFNELMNSTMHSCSGGGVLFTGGAGRGGGGVMRTDSSGAGGSLLRTATGLCAAAGGGSGDLLLRSGSGSILPGGSVLRTDSSGCQGRGVGMNSVPQLVAIAPEIFRASSSCLGGDGGRGGGEEEAAVAWHSLEATPLTDAVSGKKVRGG